MCSAEDCSRILWTNERYLTSYEHVQTYTTRKVSSLFICFLFLANHEVKIEETHDDTCVIGKKATGNGLMFWASILGNDKGLRSIEDKLSRI